MTTPTPHPNETVREAQLRRNESPCGVKEQSEAARRLAWICWHAAEDLFDAATEANAGYMWEQARAIASRILASCPVD